MSVELGSVLLGVAGLITALSGTAVGLSWRAHREARAALAASPHAYTEGLRAQVEKVREAYAEALQRHGEERDGMERALAHQRDRAEQAETRALEAIAEVAMLKVDLAQARNDITDLRGRVDAWQQGGG